MNRFVLSVFGFALAFAAATSAHAQATRTWVSGVGDDVNPCSRTAPCKTFAGAISKTAASGEINCLDPGGFGAVTITKSITIDCQEVPAGIVVSGTNGIIINITSVSDGVVNLRNLNLDGLNTGLRGISILSAAKVNIEDTLIYGFTQQGIGDVRSVAGAMLTVKNTTIRNNTGAGIAVAAAATSGAVIENVTSANNGYGVAAANGNNVIVVRSTFDGNANAGVSADPGGAVIVEDSTITHNDTGATGNVRLSGNSVSFNSIAFSGGTVSTNGNNRIFGNGSLGTAPIAAGAASSDLGLQ